MEWRSRPKGLGNGEGEAECSSLTSAHSANLQLAGGVTGGFHQLKAKRAGSPEHLGSQRSAPRRSLSAVLEDELG